MTSRSLFSTRNPLEGLSYQITGTDGLNIPVSLSLCTTREDAESHALAEARNFAKSFCKVQLHKKTKNGEETVIYDSAVEKKALYDAKNSKLFIPVPRYQLVPQF
jgi:hypothetical protein